MKRTHLLFSILSLTTAALTVVPVAAAPVNPPKTKQSKAAIKATSATSPVAAAASRKRRAADLVAAARKILFPPEGRRPGAAEMAAAGEKLTAAAAADPKNADAPFLLGVIAEQRQNIDSAIAAYSRAAVADRASMSAVQAALRLDVLRPLAARLKNPTEAAKIRYALLLDQASSALDAGDPTLAILNANEASALTSDRWEASAIAGLAHLQLHEYKEGLIPLNAARAIAPDVIKAALKPAADTCDREVRAAAYADAGQQKAGARDFTGAAEQYIKAAELFPGRPTYRLDAANACALAHDYNRALLLVKPLLKSPDLLVARRAAAYNRQVCALIRLDNSAHSVRTDAAHQIASLSNPGADTDKMAQESQQQEDKVLAEANKRSERITELKTELQAALDRYKEYSGDTLAMGDLLSKSQKLATTATDSGTRQESSILGAIAQIASIENKRKADSTKKEIDEMTDEIEKLGGSVEYKTGTD